MTTAIDIQGLSHGFGKQPVLRDVTFSVAAGDFFIIIGPNGSGKTTLMKTIAGLLVPQKGAVRIRRRPVASYRKRELARMTAYVPQGLPIDFPFTAAEVVLMGRAPFQGALGIDGARDVQIAEQAMRFTEVAHLAGRRLDQLSGGEQQRVLIARAICQEPQILLLDEPTAALDLSHQVRIMDLMEQIKSERGTTIVMVSHDINLAGMFGDRLLLLKEGRILREGPAEAVLDYETLEAAYGCKVLVDESPLGKLPRVTVVPLKYLNRKD